MTLDPTLRKPATSPRGAWRACSGLKAGGIAMDDAVEKCVADADGQVLQNSGPWR